MANENQKVIIGIVSKHYNIDKKRTDSYIRDEVKQAIFDNGGIAIGILSPNEEILYCRNNWEDFEQELLKEDIIAQLNLCDGIIIQGGTTNEPFESFIAKYCFENNIPILGICAGQNCIVDAIGGCIKYIDNPEKHNQADEDYVHSISIDNTSKFYQIVNKELIMVNSRHRNTVDNSSILDKVAFCEDGYADVIESKDKTFYIGVRFHPESLYKIDENMNNIFKKFIDIAKNVVL